MFCSRCGSPIRPDLPACPQCGRSIGDPVGAVAQSRLERHLHTLGILWMVLGVLFLIPGAVLMVMGSSVHFVIHDREIFGTALGPLILYIFGGSLLIIATGGVCVGLGFMQCRPWARSAGLILGVLAIFHPPLGTALGIYTLWVLLADERGDEYRHLKRPA
jgi:hypothetical protein